MTLEELPGYLRMLAVRAGEAAIPTANAMGESFESNVIHRLTALAHRRGTRTPAPAGGPPAMESGALAGSVNMDPASTPVVATAKVGPRLPPRDWVQEWGCDNITPRRAPRMIFIYGDLYRARRVDVPSRSYLRSTVALMVADGQFTTEAAKAFYAAMWG